MMKSSSHRLPRLFTRASLYSLCGLTALALACPASAQTTIYGTGFENPPFANGSILTGQNGWVSVGTLSPNASVISTSAARTGSQGVRVLGTDMVSQSLTSTLDAVGSYRRQVDYNAVANQTPVVVLEADVRLDGPQTTGGYVDFFAANIAARTSTGSVGELSISSDGMIYAYDGVAGSPDDNNPQIRGAITLGDWHKLAIESNFATGTTRFFVDGNFLGEFLGDADYASGIYGRGAMVTYAKYDTATNFRRDYTASFDNFRIGTVVPEPGSLALLAGSLIPGAFWLRRRKR
jgi:hypothetical protein